MAELGDGVIFLVSQPRSGSTLLQHMLAAHREIGTLPEPWLMLPFVYALRAEVATGAYNTRYAALALSDFLRRIPDGPAIWRDGIRALAGTLYQRASAECGKRYFVDKTPRYYLIIPELLELFPKAHFLFLLRNPLSVMGSILDANLNGNWRGLASPDRRRDIMDAPRLLLDGIRRAQTRGITVRYETLVASPEATMSRICEELGLPFQAEMINYGDKVRFRGTTFIDHKSVYRHTRPVADYAGRWARSFDTTHKVAMGRDYLRYLGGETVGRLGYDFGSLMAHLNILRPRHDVVVPFHLFMTFYDELNWRERLELRVRRTLHRQLARLSDRSRRLTRSEKYSEIPLWTHFRPHFAPRLPRWPWPRRDE